LLKAIGLDAVDPRSQAHSDLRAIRGGSFDSPAPAGRTSFRHRLEKGVMRADVGFRIVFGAG
jgi:formylglycine-generating enzyme required for sulfatase activity